MSDNDIALILGTLLVLSGAYDRFNNPPSNRSSTTAARYYMGLCIYMALAFISYWVLSRYPDLLRHFVSDEVQRQVERLPSALTTALVLTVLLDKVGMLAGADRWVRQKVQSLANIPHEARILARRLQRMDLQPQPEAGQRVAARLESIGLHVADIQLQHAETPQHLLTRVSLLLDALDCWEAEPGLGAFMAEFSEQVRELRRRFRQTAQKAVSRFRLVESLSAEGGDARSMELAVAYRGELREQCEELHRGACELVSRGVLQCCVTDAARRAALRAIGFADDPQPSATPLTLNQVVMLFAAVAAVLMFGMVLANAQSGNSFQDAVLRVVMVASIWSVAIVCALCPKANWTMAQRGIGGERPAAFYLAAGVMAAALGMLVSVVFKLVIFRFDLGRTWQDVALSYPWTITTFAIAAATAFQTDNDDAHFGRWQRWLEAGGQSAAIAVATHLTWLGLCDVGHPICSRPGVYPWLLGLSAVNGFAVGFLVPTWYRRALRRTPPLVAIEDRVDAIPAQRAGA